MKRKTQTATFTRIQTWTDLLWSIFIRSKLFTWKCHTLNAWQLGYHSDAICAKPVDFSSAPDCGYFRRLRVMNRWLCMSSESLLSVSTIVNGEDNKVQIVPVFRLRSCGKNSWNHATALWNPIVVQACGRQAMYLRIGEMKNIENWFLSFSVNHQFSGNSRSVVEVENHFSLNVVECNQLGNYVFEFNTCKNSAGKLCFCDWDKNEKINVNCFHFPHSALCAKWKRTEPYFPSHKI